MDFACSDLLTDKKALQSSQNIEAGKKEAKEESCEKPEKAKGIISLSWMFSDWLLDYRSVAFVMSV